jgi:hypothetical protein
LLPSSIALLTFFITLLIGGFSTTDGIASFTIWASKKTILEQLSGFYFFSVHILTGRLTTPILPCHCSGTTYN